MRTEKKPVVIDEIVVLTTKRGRESIERMLFDDGGKPGNSGWKKLLKALEKDGIPVDGHYGFGPTPESIRIPASADRKTQLEDIASSEENAVAADFFLQTLRGFTDDSGCRVYASIAGGRKTMSALLLSCMSLLGRDNDKVLHVLVNPPYDGRLDPPFLFPEGKLKHRDVNGRAWRSDAAEIELIDLPFVKMRGWYQDKFKSSPPSYGQLVREVQKVAPEAKPIAPELAFDLGAGDIYVASVRAKLAPWEFMVMACSLLVPDLDLFNACHAAQANAGCVGWEGDFRESRRISSWNNGEYLKEEFSKVRSAAKKKLGNIPSIAPWIEGLFPRGIKKTAKYPKGRISADIKEFREHFGL